MMEMLDAFLRAKRLQGLTEKSLKSYRDILLPFCRFCGCPISALTFRQVENYLEYILDKKLSKATYCTYCRNIRVFLRYCAEQGRTDIDYNRIFVPKSPRRAVRLLSYEDVQTVLEAASAEDRTLVLRNAAVLALMFDSGLRQAEVCRLRQSDLRLPEHYAVVRGKGGKERYVPLGEAVSASLTAYLAVRGNSESPYLFLDRNGGPMSENAVRLFVHRLSKKTGVDFSSHKLRHNFATNYCLDHYEEDGQIDIYKLMHLLGHTNVKTTEIYLHFALDILAAKGHLSHLDRMKNEWK